MLDRCVLNNREETAAIVGAVYETYRFDPGRDRHQLERARSVKGVLAYLLKNDAKLAESKIGELLDCPPKEARTHASEGENLMRTGEDVRAAIEKIRARVREKLGRAQEPAPRKPALVLAEPVQEELELVVTRDTPVKDVARIVGKILVVPYGLIMSKSRVEPELDARHIAMAISRMIRPERSKPYIGKHFSRDHTSVLSGLKKINRCLGEGNPYPELLEKIKKVCAALSFEPSSLMTPLEEPRH